MFYREINGISVAYEMRGKGPALVLLHGFIIDSKIWRPQLEGMSKDFTLIAWDAPGTGESSDPPENFTMADWADCLAQLLDSIDVKKAHVLGLSWGGILAQEFYNRHSERVLSLILVDTYAGWKGSLPEPMPHERLAACMQDASLPAADFVRKYISGMFGNSFTESMHLELTNIMSRFHPAGFRLMSVSCAEADTRHLLPNILVPVLLVWGEADKRSPLNIAYQIRDAIPGAKLVIISNAGHISNLEEPERFNKVVTDFCKSPYEDFS